jgi:CheY-like chemotaxis protein
MKKVLIANGLRDLFREKSSFLDRAEIKMFTAAANDEVLNICRKEEIDLIVTVLDAPGMRSEDLFRIIKTSKELRAVSTIIVCEDTLANRERCKQCRPNAVVTLPVDPLLLFLKMHQFLNVAPRMGYRAALAVGIEGKFKNNPLQFWTENISASGMLIRADEPLAQGEGIFFSFFLNDGTHVSGYGEITRVVRQPGAPHAFQYGIKFTNIAASDRSAIEAVVKRSSR